LNSPAFKHDCAASVNIQYLSYATTNATPIYPFTGNCVAKDAILSTIGKSNWVHKNLSKILKTTAFYKNHLFCVAK
jgi:hypothetical protein